MSDLEVLLAVQERDTVIDQLRHRRRTLPERADLDAAVARRDEILADRAELVARRDEVAARQAGLEQTIAASEARVAEIDRRLYSGEVTASRDLQAMTDEIASIRRRVSSLEDSVLEAMEEREPLDAALEALDASVEGLAGEAERLQRCISDAESAIDADLASEEAARSQAAAAVPAGLSEIYEKLRSRLGGIGAARLEHGVCMGCRLRLPATEIDRLKREPPGSLTFCDQCGRILVH